MPSQPVPNVSEEDVRRIALRDYGADKLFQVLSIIGEFGKQSWNQSSPRVWLAILKLANGDMERLTEETRVAIEDYRDVLAPAEYPRYSREIGFSSVPDQLASAAIEADWAQYRAWLEGK